LIVPNGGTGTRRVVEPESAVIDEGESARLWLGFYRAATSKGVAIGLGNAKARRCLAPP
jgi:hypothetical protein